jgi:hypothetical protein
VSAKTYAVLNGAAPGAAAAVPISTGTAIKTHLQIATNTTSQAIRVVEWWTEFDGATAATPIKVELIRHTGGPQTTLTAYGAADIAKVNDPNAPATSIQSGEPGLPLDHLCRNRACVNPDHLEPKTIKANVLAGEGITALNARKTECANGHALTPENTYVDPRGWRQCRECGREASRRSQARRRRLGLR